MTVGGQAGKSSTSNTTAGAPLGAGWLDAIGLGGSNGVDTIMHSGEGNISSIKWSLSGKFVVWVNEYGIKILRTSLHLGSEDLDWAWKRVNHIPRPTGDIWDEFASVWRASAEWIDEDGLESDNEEHATPSVVAKNGLEVDAHSVRSDSSARVKRVEMPKEKLIVGWGGTVWILNIFDGVRGAGRDRKIGKVEVVTM